MFGGRLTIGQRSKLQVRVERLTRHADACRLMYISDIHLRGARCEALSRQVVDAVRVSRVDAVLLGGDLLDSAAQLADLRELVRVLTDLAPVLAVGGNHDRRVGMARVRDAVVAGGGRWIHECAEEVSHGARRIVVAGPEATHVPVGDVRILCAHNPRVWKAVRGRGYDLVLAGHLHGCQAVAFRYADRLYPGALFYPYCYLRHQHESTTLVVSRGVSDLIPLRWRCPREVVLCHV